MSSEALEQEKAAYLISIWKPSEIHLTRLNLETRCKADNDGQTGREDWAMCLQKGL
jgi:hypothetical protein